MRRTNPVTLARGTARLAAVGVIACAGVAGTAASTARAQETPLVFQGNLFDQLPEPFFPTMFRVRDLDGDGFVDLAIAGRDPDDRVMTRRGTGDGRFVPLQTLAAPGFIDWLEVADVDGDGDDDMVAAWRGDVPRLVCYRGIGAGLFDEATVLADVELGGENGGVGRDPQSVALGDFDRDGDIDIAVTNYIGQSLDVFANRGAQQGGFTFERTARIRLATFLGGVGYPRVAAAGDMDGDGDLDLVVNEIGGTRVAVLRNDGGRFARPLEYRAPEIGTERPGVSGLELVDVDGDGDLDAFCPALLLKQTQKVIAFVNDGAGRFTQTLVGEGSPTGYAFCTHMADFDGDGDGDAVSGAALPGTIAVARRTGAGAFSFEVDFAPQFGQLIRHLDAADVDGDCDLDIVGIDGPGRTVFVRRNVTPQQQGCGGVAEAAGGASEPRADAAPASAVVREPVPQVDRNRDGTVDATDAALWLGELSRPLRGTSARRDGVADAKPSPAATPAATPSPTAPKGGAR